MTEANSTRQINGAGQTVTIAKKLIPEIGMRYASDTPSQHKHIPFNIDLEEKECRYEIKEYQMTAGKILYSS